jgi:hypothetical protein
MKLETLNSMGNRCGYMVNLASQWAHCNPASSYIFKSDLGKNTLPSLNGLALIANFNLIDYNSSK